MKKLMKKKVNVFGKKLPVFMIALLGIAVVSAALIPYFGQITGFVTVSGQGLTVDGGNYGTPIEETWNEDSFTSLEERTYVNAHSLRNDANVDAEVQLVRTCDGLLTDNDCKDEGTEVITTTYSTAELQATGSATAEWTADEEHTGKYSAKLTATGPDNAAVIISVTPTLLNSITELSFWYNHEAYNAVSPHIVGPDFDIVLLADNGNYYMAGRTVVESTDVWKNADAVDIDSSDFTSTGHWWLMNLNTTTPVGTYTDFVALKAEAVISDANIVKVVINLEPAGSSSGIVYVDDIKINDVTYSLESIQGNLVTVPAGTTLGFVIENYFPKMLVPDTYTITTEVKPFA